MDQYKSSYPSTPEVPSSLRQFFETFYKISDTPEAHDKYVDCFTKDAVIIMARGNVEGCDGESLSLSPTALLAIHMIERKKKCQLERLKNRCYLVLYTLLALTAPNHQAFSPSATRCGPQFHLARIIQQRFSPSLGSQSPRQRSCSTAR